MSRRSAWWSAVLTGWAATAIGLGFLIAGSATNSSISQVIQQAVLLAAVPCVVIGGPMVAIAVRAAGRLGGRDARQRGWAAGLGLIVVAVVISVAAGAAIALGAILAVLVMAGAEVELALWLYRRNVVRSLAP